MVESMGKPWLVVLSARGCGGCGVCKLVRLRRRGVDFESLLQETGACVGVSWDVVRVELERVVDKE